MGACCRQDTGRLTTPAGMVLLRESCIEFSGFVRPLMPKYLITSEAEVVTRLYVITRNFRQHQIPDSRHQYSKESEMNHEKEKIKGESKPQTAAARADHRQHLVDHRLWWRFCRRE
ncbi:MAG: hypothetical protein QM296_00380 [Bacillota bacterium]|nr:hypothetical protein [Bacillota bacterium]